mgnify:FL=1
MEPRENLSLPIHIKPFRVRSAEAWSSFLSGEHELRALMAEPDRAAVSETLAERCAGLLAPAFANPAFELGHNGERYELILTPEGDRTRLFQLAYFRKQAPRELLERWNIQVGRTQSTSFILRMYGRDIALEDVQVWVENTEGGVGLELYCEKLRSAPREERYMLYILLDQALGEIAAMRYVDYLDLLEEAKPGKSMTLNQLAGYIAAEVDPEGWPQAGNPELACRRYTAYEGKPSEDGELVPRRDIFAGVTCCIPLIQSYFQGDSYYMDQLGQDGIFPGFFYYSLEGVDPKTVLDLRDQLEQAITARCGEGVVTFTGGATGTEMGYLDFIAWDLKILLDSAAEVFAGAPVNWAAFHTFRQDAEGIGLKLEQEDAL